MTVLLPDISDAALVPDLSGPQVGDTWPDAWLDYDPLQIQVKQYVPCPTPSRAQLDNNLVRCIMGPVGSGKSVACVSEVLMRAAMQRPTTKGIRPSRWAVIRATYPELISTTIRTWEQWCPCPVVYSAPIECHVKARLEDGTTIDCEVLFISLDRPADARKVLSLELTGIFVNEAKTLRWSLIQDLVQRIGRYPEKDLYKDDKEVRAGLLWDDPHGKEKWNDLAIPTQQDILTRLGMWSGVVMDTNPPPMGHWFHRRAEEMKPEGWSFYRQPGALMQTVKANRSYYVPNPAAENINNHTLGFAYYTRHLGAADKEWIKVYILGQYGTVHNGRPVYEDQFVENVHVSQEPLEILRGCVLWIGLDFGLTPAAIAMQVSPLGQIRVLREWCAKHDGIEQLLRNTVGPALHREFSGMVYRFVGDPAGDRGCDSSKYITAASTIRSLGYNYTSAPVPNNDFLIRRDSLIGPMERMISGQPGLTIDPSCQIFIEGLRGGYKYAQIQVVGDTERFHERPEKNEYSHAVEAGQYVVLGAVGPPVQARRQREPKRAAPDRWVGAG